MKDNNKKKIAVKCEANVCPICGGMNLEYCGERVDDDDGCTYGWICKDCGASGRESYELQFVNHCEVKAKDGTPAEQIEDATPDPDAVTSEAVSDSEDNWDICPVCSGKLSFYDTVCLKYTIEKKWTCTRCGATGSAEFEPEWIHTFNEHKDVRLADGSVWDGKPAIDPFEACSKAISPCTPTQDAFINLDEYACPVCGGRIKENGEFNTQEIFIYSPWRCTHCKATGIAEFEDATGDVYYDFNGHGNVHLADGSVWDGKPIPATESAEEEHRITGSITLLNDFDMEDALLALAVANIGANEEHGRITIIDASVSDAVEALAREGILLQAITYEGNNAPVVVPPAPVKAATGWFVPVTWEMFGVVRIPFEDAPTLEDAFKQIKDNPNIELPKGHYVDDSFAPSYEVEQIEEVRSLYNDNRPDAEV